MGHTDAVDFGLFLRGWTWSISPLKLDAGEYDALTLKNTADDLEDAAIEVAYGVNPDA